MLPGFWILTDVKMKSRVFCVVIPCSSEGVLSELHGIITKDCTPYFVSCMYSVLLCLQFTVSEIKSNVKRN
jgi:hypothetical protein